MNSLENSKLKNSEKLVDDLYNFCKRGNIKKIEKILSSPNKNSISNYIIDEAIRIVIRNFNIQNNDYLNTLTYLLKFNTDINFKNESQNNATILMEAACSEKIEILQTILNFFEIKKTHVKSNSNNIGNVDSYAGNETNNMANSPISVNMEDKKITGNNSRSNKSKNATNILSETNISNNLNNTNSNKSNNNNNCLDLNIKDKDGQTVLHKIIHSGTLDETYKSSSLQLLIDKGANVNEENILGFTPLALTLLMGNSALSEYLIKNGADVNHIVSYNNENMLHCAVRGKNPAVIAFLQNVDLKHRNKHGETPVDLANNLKLLSFKNFFNKIDAENSEINLNNKIISSMLPINDIINKNYSNVLMHLQELKACLKINNSEMRFIWNALLAEYYSFFESELLITDGNINDKNLFNLNANSNYNANNEIVSLNQKIYLANNNFNNNSISNNINNFQVQHQENINSNINSNIASNSLNQNAVGDVFSAGNFVIKNTSNNKNNFKRNRKSSNSSQNPNSSAIINTISTTPNTINNNNNNNMIDLNDSKNPNFNFDDKNIYLYKKSNNRQVFIEKFIEFFNNNDKSQTDNEHKKIFYYNSGLFWFKFSSYAKCFEQLFNCLKINFKKDDFLFHTNSSLIFINILQNLQEFQLANKLIESLESYLNISFISTSNKLSNKSILSSLNTNASSQLSQINDEKQEMLNSPNKKSLIHLYNQREIINKSNSHEELNCILNILKSQNFLFEEKIEECKKFLNEYKRLWNILIIKESFPILNTLKKIYHFMKIRLHYVNNTFSKGLKHLNFLSNFNSKNEQEHIQLQILNLNNSGILNLKQKKYCLAQFNFKNGLNILKKFSNNLNFNFNISQIAEALLFNLALSYFFEKKFEACYNTLIKIKQGKITSNPFYFYRLGISCLETELFSIKEKKAKEAYNDLLEKYVVKNSQFNRSEKNTIKDYSDKNNVSIEANKSQISNLIKSPVNVNSNINRNNSNLNSRNSPENNYNFSNNENDSNDNNTNKSSHVYNFYYILKNSENLFFESEKISEAINNFISVIKLIKSKDINTYLDKEFSELCNFYNLNSNIQNNQILTSTNNNYTNNNTKNKYSNNTPINIGVNNPNTNSESNLLDNFNRSKIHEKSQRKSYDNILVSSYLNLLFCLSLKKRFNEMLFYIADLESLNLNSLKELNYNIDNYKIEAYLGLNLSYKVIELLKKNMLNGNYTYSCLDSKANFLSKVYGEASEEINLKIALYSNVIKLNFLSNNFLEVEKGIVKIMGLLNMNLSLNQNIENISLPSHLINLLIYYYLIKENFDTAIYLIKKRRLPPGSFGFLLENTSKNLK